jgi:osomolarity two-component system, sensor histidine kinase SLN1
VSAHNGSIAVDSSGVVGEGTIFTVVLELTSLRVAEMADIEEGQTTTWRSSRSNPSKSAVHPAAASCTKCLVVDDSPLNRKFLCRLLKPHFDSVVTADDGMEAVAMIQEQMAKNEAFDLVCIDSVMPVGLNRHSLPYHSHRSYLTCCQNMSGPEAVRTVRDSGYGGIMIGVTGNVLEEQVEDFMAHGVDHVVGKPVDVNLIMQFLDSKSWLSCH